MKSKLVSLFQILAVLALLCSLVRLPTAQPVAAIQDISQEKQTLLVLAIPSVDNLNIPPGLLSWEARDMAVDILEKQAGPVLAELHRLQEDGLVSAYELRLDQGAIAVWSETGLPRLDSASHLSGNLAPQAGAACGQRGLQALEDTLYRQSRMHLLGRQPDFPQETDPSIYIYFDEGYGDFYGYTASDVPVNMRLLRDGAEFFADSTTSESDGYYGFYSEWSSDCEYQGYDWMLLPGDVVEVTANGNTISSVVSLMDIWMDPGSNVVGGRVEAGRTVETWVYWDQDSCYSDSYSMTVGTDAWGYFSADYDSLPLDFDGRAWGYVHAIDANGNYTYQYLEPFHLAYSYAYEELYGTILPDTAYTVELLRSGSRIDLIQDTSDPGGYFYTYFYNQVPQPGDTINLSFSSFLLSLDLPPLEATLDPVTNLLSGNTGPGWLVKAYIYRRYYGNVISTCGYDSECTTATADGAGNFSFATGFDAQRGDIAYLYAYDAQGNYVYRMINAPVLGYNYGWEEVIGYWGTGPSDLTAILTDSAYNVKDTATASASGSGSFYAWFYQDVLPGDHIRVGDGVLTETMTVQDLSGSLNSATDLLSGSTNGVYVLAEYYDFNRTGYDDYECYETAPAAGSYSFDLSGMGVEAQDNADLYSKDSDGHFTTAYLHAFEVNVELYYDDLYGYTSVPSTTYTANLWDGAVLLETYAGNSYGDGYFSTWFTNTLEAGLRVEVLADGQTASVTIPVLSINANPATNSLYGQAPANEPFELELDNYFHCPGSYSGWCNSWFYVQAQADGSGNYSQSFDDLYDWDGYTDTCHTADVDAWCAQKYLYYYQPDEHQVMYQAPLSEELADVYESDDTPAEATLAGGYTTHTFHTESDVDWFAIPVTAEQVGKPLYIRTLHLGPNADTYMFLYDTDGSTMLDSDDDSGLGRASYIMWTPLAAGTYYVMVEPYYSYYSVRCGTGYSFVVSNVTSMLPFVAR